MPPFVKGQSGNPAGKNRTLPEIGAELSGALRDLAGKQRPGSPRGTTWAQHLARQLWQDATRTGVGAAQAAVRLKTGTFIAERLEGRPVSPVELKAMIAQANMPQVVPWDDSIPGLDYGDADAPPAPELPGPVARDAPPPSLLAPPARPVPEDPESARPAAAPADSAAPEAPAAPPESEAIRMLRHYDQSGLAWRMWRAQQGLPPAPPPWLQSAQSAQDAPDAPTEGQGPSPSRPPVFGRPRARATWRRDGEHLTSVEAMTRLGAVPEAVDVDRRS